jgi:hypothetical protein
VSIQILTQNKPHLYFEAVDGGSLPASTTFYFIGFNAFGTTGMSSPYYGYAPGPVSEEYSVNTTPTKRKIKMELYKRGGSVSSFSDAGGGLTTVHSAAHGLADGDTVYLRNSGVYTGVYVISNVSVDSFDILLVFSTSPSGALWYSEPGMELHPFSVNFSAFYYKWDYYSMKRPDGSFFQWCNENDPTIDDEWGPTEASPNKAFRNYGHYRWGGAYYNQGRRFQYFTEAPDGSLYCEYEGVTLGNGSANWESGQLYERNSYSSLISSMTYHPQISARRYYVNESPSYRYFDVPDWVDIEAPAISVYVDNTEDYNTWAHFLTALAQQKPEYEGKSYALARHGTPSTAYQIYNNALVMRGHIFTGGGSYDIIWYSKFITLLHGFIQGTNLLTLNGGFFLSVKG